MELTTQEWHLSVEGIKLCSLVYDLSNGELYDAVEELGATEPRYITNFMTDTELLVCRWKGCIYVVPRATKSLADVKQDMKAWRKKGRHLGFLEAADSVWGQVSNYAADRPHVPIVCVGHSLGGAIAVNHAEWLTKQGRDVHLITYGQPRVYGPSAGKKAVAGLQCYSRWVHNRDGVPRLPPSFFGLYKHHGDLRYINHKGELSDKTSDWVKGAARGWRKMFTTFNAKGLEDHSAKEYLADILALEPKPPRWGNA